MVDQFAANGYYTLMPDIFLGDPLPLNRPEGFDIMAWIQKGSNGNNPHTWEAVDPIIAKSIKYLQEKGFKNIGAVGYCFVSVKFTTTKLDFGQRIILILHQGSQICRSLPRG